MADNVDNQPQEQSWKTTLDIDRMMAANNQGGANDNGGVPPGGGPVGADDFRNQASENDNGGSFDAATAARARGQESAAEAAAAAADDESGGSSGPDEKTLRDTREFAKRMMIWVRVPDLVTGSGIEALAELQGYTLASWMSMPGTGKLREWETILVVVLSLIELFIIIMAVLGLLIVACAVMPACQAAFAFAFIKDYIMSFFR